jgi:hypothetical protein
MATETAGDDNMMIESTVMHSEKSAELIETVKRISKLSSYHIHQVESGVMGLANDIFQITVAIQDLFTLIFDEQPQQQQDGVLFAPRIAAELVFHSYLQEEPSHSVYFPPSRSRKEKTSYLQFYKIVLCRAFEVPVTCQLDILNGTREVDDFVQNFTDYFLNDSQRSDEVIQRMGSTVATFFMKKACKVKETIRRK